jgi:hypothetical protein
MKYQECLKWLNIVIKTSTVDLDGNSAEYDYITLGDFLYMKAITEYNSEGTYILRRSQIGMPPTKQWIFAEERENRTNNELNKKNFIEVFTELENFLPFKLKDLEVNYD